LLCRCFHLLSDSLAFSHLWSLCIQTSLVSYSYCPDMNWYLSLVTLSCLPVPWLSYCSGVLLFSCWLACCWINSIRTDISSYFLSPSMSLPCGMNRILYRIQYYQNTFSQFCLEQTEAWPLFAPGLRVYQAFIWSAKVMKGHDDLGLLNINLIQVQQAASPQLITFQFPVSISLTTLTVVPLISN